MIRFTSHSPKETENFAYELSKKLRAGDVLAFRGSLGAGKTAFVRGLAKGLSPDAQVSSPTFALVNDYGGDIPLYHFDMYRITSMDDLYSTGFFDYLDMGGILAIEWSENVEFALPPDTITVSIEPKSDEERNITVTGGERF